MNPVQLAASSLESVHEMRTATKSVGLEKLRANIELLRESKAMLCDAQQDPSRVGVDPAVVGIYLAEVVQELQYYQDYLAFFPEDTAQAPLAPLSAHLLTALDQVQRWQCPLYDDEGKPEALLALRGELRNPSRSAQNSAYLPKQLSAVPHHQRFNLACLVYDAESGDARLRAGNFQTWLLAVLGSRFALEPRLEQALVALLWATVQTDKQARRIMQALSPNIYSDHYRECWERERRA